MSSILIKIHPKQQSEFVGSIDMSELNQNSMASHSMLKCGPEQTWELQVHKLHSISAIIIQTTNKFCICYTKVRKLMKVNVLQDNQVKVHSLFRLKTI